MTKLSQSAVQAIEKGVVVVHVLAALQVPPGLIVPPDIANEIAQYMQELRIPLHEVAAAAALSLLETDGVVADSSLRHLYQA